MRASRRALGAVIALLVAGCQAQLSPEQALAMSQLDPEQALADGAAPPFGASFTTDQSLGPYNASGAFQKVS